jgi:sirohydrochlorin cobaltochelatase
LKDTPAVLLAAFGTTIPEARESYSLLEEEVRRRLPQADIRWAFTSTVVRRRLAEGGETIDSPAEALAHLKGEGFRQVVVQSVHVTPGQEFLRLSGETLDGLAISFGRPLLDQPSDYDRVLDILADQVDPAVPTLFVGHGNDNDPLFNEANHRMDRLVRQRFPGAVLASLEGSPGPAVLEEIRPIARAAGRVHFIPLLFVAGDHVVNDLLGDEPTSWKNALGVPHVSCGPPLGKIPAIREIYVDHLVRVYRAYDPNAVGVGG